MLQNVLRDTLKNHRMTSYDGLPPVYRQTRCERIACAQCPLGNKTWFPAALSLKLVEWRYIHFLSLSLGNVSSFALPRTKEMS